MADGVVAVQVVGRVHADGLLAHGGLVAVARRLVVVREGDAARQHAHDQAGVQLHVRVGHGAREARRLQLGVRAADQRVVGLQHVQVLDHRVAVAVAHQVLPHDLPGAQPVDVVRGDQQAVVAHHVQRPHAAARLGAHDHAAGRAVPVDAGVDVDLAGVLGALERAVQRARLVVGPDQVAVHEHLGVLRELLEVAAVERHQAGAGHDLAHAGGVGVARDVHGQRHVLHDAHAGALRRLGRADHAELRGVQAPRLHQLAVLLDRRVDAAHVRQGREVRHAVQHLRHAVPRVLVVLQAPDAGAQRVLEAGVDDGRLDDARDVVLVDHVAHGPGVEGAVGVQLFGDHLLDLFDQLAVVLAEDVGQQHARGVDALVDVRVAVVHDLGVLEKAARHVAEVQRLLAEVGPDVRQELVLEHVDQHARLDGRVVHQLARHVTQAEVLAQVVHRVALRVDAVGVHDAAAQVVQRAAVVVAADVVDDVLDDVHVRLDAERPEQHEQRDVDAHVVDVAPDVVAVLVGVHRELEDGQLGRREHVVHDRPDLGDVRVAGVLVVREHERLVLAAAILRDYALLGAVDDEVREHIVLALVFLQQQLRQHRLGHAVAGAHHDGDHADAHVLERAVVVDVAAVLAQLGDVGVDVGVQRAAVREVAQPRFLRGHDLGAAVLLGDHRPRQHGVLHVHADDDAVLLQLLAELVLDLDGVEAVDHLLHLVQHELVERPDLMADEFTEALAREQRVDHTPRVATVFHSARRPV